MNLDLTKFEVCVLKLNWKIDSGYLVTSLKRDGYDAVTPLMIRDARDRIRRKAEFCLKEQDTS